MMIDGVEWTDLIEGGWSDGVEANWHPPQGFFLKSASQIAKGLRESSKTLQQAVSRLNFYINRAGNSVPNHTELVKARALLGGMKEAERLERDVLRMADSTVGVFLRDNPAVDTPEFLEYAARRTSLQDVDEDAMVRMVRDYAVDEKAPPGFSGTVKAMIDKHKFSPAKAHALAWAMYKRGAKPHYPKEKGKARYKTPELWQAHRKAVKEALPEQCDDAVDTLAAMVEMDTPPVIVTAKQIKESSDRADTLLTESADVKASTPTLEQHYVQYVQQGNTFRPAGTIALREKLDTCAYEAGSDMQGVFFTKMKAKTDKLYGFKSSVMEAIIKEVDRFWKLNEEYKKLGLLHNRGIMVEGPPGTGKSAMFQQVAEMMLARGDIIIFARSVGAVREGLKAYREVEPTRPVVVVMEDMDEYVGYGERELLNLMDGDSKVEGVLFLGSTNYIDRFPERMLRPGRFDKVIHLASPPYEGRLVYLTNKLKPMNVSEKEVERLAKESDGLSFGHLRELVIGAYALKEPVNEVLARLRKKLGSSALTGPSYQESVTEGGDAHGYSIKDVQTYYDMQMVQGKDKEECAQLVKAKFNLKHLVVGPTGDVESSEVEDDPEQAQPETPPQAPSEPTSDDLASQGPQSPPKAGNRS